MPNGPIDPLTGPKFVLEGRVVTMTEEPTSAIPEFIEQGAIYIEGGEIKHLQDAGDAPPQGFETAPRIQTNGTIYPGLMELHNHLCYNAMPLWDVPRCYLNNSNWRNTDDYRQLITKPSQVLARSEGNVEALVRFTECRCLLGGVTTSQGITLSGAKTKEYYEGIVRNVERTREADLLPEAGTKIANPEKGKANDYLDILKKYEGRCYLQHLSEGTNDTARNWFVNLKIDADSWALTDAFAGIHSTALTLEDLNVIHDHGGSMIWSPLSNYLLYGATADLVAARDSGILMGIGSDWAPSGSKNLLGELKVAWLASEECDKENGGDPIFTPKEILAMATSNAAKIVKWDEVLGSIEPGKRADLLVIEGQGTDDYMHLIETLETSIAMVVVNGVPRYGTLALMGHFQSDLADEITVGGADRVLHLGQTTTHELVKNLTLTEATARLEDAMGHLPALAKELDDQIDSDEPIGSMGAGSQTRWLVECDFEEDDQQTYELAAKPYTYYITEAMDLEGITVADDPEFLKNLVKAINLPKFVKERLPGLYGQVIPLDGSVPFLREVEKEVPDEIRWTARSLKTFLKSQRGKPTLTPGDYKSIVDQALLVLEENYVHLPLKRAMHAVDPVQRLKILRHRLDEMEENVRPPEIEFHTELLATFNSLRDLHTSYRLPSPYRWITAWLPFFAEEYQEDGIPRYMVSKVIGNPGPDHFKPGVELLYWNGTPIDRVVARNAERQAGSNKAARYARGLNSLTIRPLSHCPPPEEEWVTLRYKDVDGEEHQCTLEWVTFEAGVDAFSADPEALLRSPAKETKEAAMALGFDPKSNDIQNAKKLFFAGGVLSGVTRATPQAGAESSPVSRKRLDTHLDTRFRPERITVKGREYGYIRIFSFNVSDADDFVREFVQLAEALPEEGLIIDVRGNPGGNIHAAELLLQVLTPREIEPESAQLINSSVNLRLSMMNDSLEKWEESIKESVRTGAQYSQGFPITPRERCNDIGQRYYGPVVLIVDALCYSAADMFAAGFQDHNIGEILGIKVKDIGANTGAGGANVWTHGQLQILSNPNDDLDTPAFRYHRLPRGSDLSVAFRRTLRVGERAGTLVEDLGVSPKNEHAMTRRDLLEGNVDLIIAATELLKGKPHPIKIKTEPREGALPKIGITSRNITDIDVFIFDRPRKTLDLEGRKRSSKDGSTTSVIDLQDLAGDIRESRVILDLKGYEGKKLVAARHEEIEIPTNP